MSTPLTWPTVDFPCTPQAFNIHTCTCARVIYIKQRRRKFTCCSGPTGLDISRRCPREANSVIKRRGAGDGGRLGGQTHTWRGRLCCGDTTGSAVAGVGSRHRTRSSQGGDGSALWCRFVLAKNFKIKKLNNKKELFFFSFLGSELRAVSWNIALLKSPLFL